MILPDGWYYYNVQGAMMAKRDDGIMICTYVPTRGPDGKDLVVPMMVYFWSGSSRALDAKVLDLACVEVNTKFPMAPWVAETTFDAGSKPPVIL